MISNELKKELKEKKNIISIVLFTILMFSFIMLNGYSSIGMSIITSLIFSIIIIIVFKFLKWILWVFFRPITDDIERNRKREKLTERIASSLVGTFMLMIIVSQIMTLSQTMTFSNKTNNTSSVHTSMSNIHSDDKNTALQVLNPSNTSTSNIHSDLNSCESLKARFQSCVSRSYRGLECFPGTDIVLPERCRY